MTGDDLLTDLAGAQILADEVSAMLAERGIKGVDAAQLTMWAADVTQLQGMQVRGPSFLRPSMVLKGTIANTHVDVWLESFPLNRREIGDPFSFLKMDVAEGGPTVSGGKSRTRTWTWGLAFAPIFSIGSGNVSLPFAFNWARDRTKQKGKGYNPQTGRLTQVTQAYQNNLTNVYWRITLGSRRKNLLGSFGRHDDERIIRINDQLSYARPVAPAAAPAPAPGATPPRLVAPPATITATDGAALTDDGITPFPEEPVSTLDAPVARTEVRPGDALSPEENERIFQERIVPRHLAGRPRRARPRLIIVAGQTGAGKTRITEIAKTRLQLRGVDAADHRPGFIDINMDDFNPHHPEYSTWLLEDLERAAARVRPDGERWWNRAQEYAIENGNDVLLESAMATPEEFEDIARRFRAQGYRVEVIGAAVPRAWSLLGLVSRYWREVLAAGRGRWVDTTVHDRTYDGVVRGLRAVDQEGLVDQIELFRRDGTVVYLNEMVDDDEGGLVWRDPPRAVDALERERRRPRAVQEFDQLMADITALRDDLPPAWFVGELDRIADLATPLAPQAVTVPSRLEATLMARRPDPSRGVSGEPEADRSAFPPRLFDLPLGAASEALLPKSDGRQLTPTGAQNVMLDVLTDLFRRGPKEFLKRRWTIDEPDAKNAEKVPPLPADGVGQSRIGRRTGRHTARRHRAAVHAITSAVSQAGTDHAAAPARPTR